MFFFQNAVKPTARFHSTDIKDLGGGKLAIKGDLTLMGVTKSLVLDTTLNKIGQSTAAGYKAGFSATTHLSRKDFGITAIPSDGDEVTIIIEIEAVREEADNKRSKG